MLVHCRRCNNAVDMDGSSLGLSKVCPYCGGVVSPPTSEDAGQDSEAVQDSEPESPFPSSIAWLLVIAGHFFIWFVVALPTSATMGVLVVLPIVLLELAVWQRAFLFSVIQSIRTSETTAPGEPEPYPCPDCSRQVSRLATTCPDCGRRLTPDDSSQDKGKSNSR